MSFRVIVDECIGCGGCEYACPTGALAKTDSFLGLFAIDPFRCDDCEQCLPKCPVDAIVVDPAWPICHGAGCPLSSKRLADTDCNIWQTSCPTCGGPLWRTASAEVDGASGAPAPAEWRCPRCDDGRRVGCPKISHLDEPVPVSSTGG